MKKLTRQIVMQIFILFMISCTQQAPVDKMLDDIYALTYSSPDSAYAVLRRINERDLNRTQSKYYDLLTIRINDLLDNDIAADSVMLSSLIDYFKQSGQPEKLALAYFHQGRSNSANKNYEAAFHSYIHAVEYSGGDLKIKNRALYNSGLIHRRTEAYDEAGKWYRAAYEASLNTEPEMSIRSSIAIGNVFLHQEKTDSALYYFDRAFELSESADDDSFRFDIMQSTIVALIEAEEYSRAMDLCRQCSREFDAVTDKKIEYFLSSDWAVIYYYLDQPDSALYYAGIAEKYALSRDDTEKLAGTYELLSMIENEKGNNEQAFDYYMKQMEYEKKLAKEAEQHKIVEINKKYNTELLENENKLLTVKHQRSSVIFISIILAFGITIVYIRLKNKANKAQLEREKVERENDILKMEKEIASLQKRTENHSEAIANVVLGQIGIIKQIAELENCKNDKDKTSKISEISNLLNSELIINTIRNIDPGYVEDFREKYPQLDQKLMDVCMMLMLDFSDIMITLFVSKQRSINSVRQLKTSIRTDLKITKHHRDIKKFIEEDFRPINLRSLEQQES